MEVTAGVYTTSRSTRSARRVVEMSAAKSSVKQALRLAREDRLLPVFWDESVFIPFLIEWREAWIWVAFLVPAATRPVFPCRWNR